MEKLLDEQLEDISGGGIFYAKDITCSDPNNPWEVIDDYGNVIGRYPTYNKAVYYAGYNRVSMDEYSWKELNDLREKYK